jgi:hypothetical protein
MKETTPNAVHFWAIYDDVAGFVGGKIYPTEESAFKAAADRAVKNSLDWFEPFPFSFDFNLATNKDLAHYAEICWCYGQVVVEVTAEDAKQIEAANCLTMIRNEGLILSAKYMDAVNVAFRKLPRLTRPVRMAAV